MYFLIYQLNPYIIFPSKLIRDFNECDINKFVTLGNKM